MSGWTGSDEDRFIRALKGISTIANPGSRLVIKNVTLRDLGGRINVRSHNQATTLAGGSGTNKLTDPNGNPYAMLDILGFADGATLKY